MAQSPSNGSSISYDSGIDRWFVFDAQGKAVAFRRSKEEAEAAAAELPPPVPPRVRGVPPPSRNLPTTHRELRPGFFDRRPTPRVVLRRPRSR
jgi:hypothetical protein